MTGKHPPDDRNTTQTRAVGVDMLPSGTRLADRYRIEEIIGVGGMGVVYRAHDEQLQTDIAIKLLRMDRQLDEEAMARFRREILLARQVSHSNVIRLHDIGRDGDLLFLTMDYLPGRTLREVLADGALEIDAVIDLGRDLAEALAAAHGRGVVHRDLKPSNILIDENGRAHIMDFGIARARDSEELTVAGQIVGTPAYLSPEQVRGEKIDHRSDQFALGLVLCEAIMARLPDNDSTLNELLGRRASGHTPDPGRLRPDLPAWLIKVLRNCLAARPEDRYHDTTELARDLATGQARRRRRWPVWQVASPLLGIGIIALAIWQWTTLPEPATAPSAPGAAAVLPFHNATGRATMDWAARGLAESIADSLAEVPELQVADSLRVFRLLQDLRLNPAALSPVEQSQLFELLELQHLVSGRIDESDRGLRIELTLHEQGQVEAHRITAEAPAGDPLAAVPELLQRLGQRLTGRAETSPLAALSANTEAMIRYDAGVELLSRGQSIAAIDALDEAVELDPTFAAAWARRASALEAAGRYEEAVDSAETAVTLLRHHDGRLALDARSRLATLSGDLNLARDTLAALVETYPADVEARTRLGDVLIDLGELGQARQALSQVVELDSQHPRAWYLLGKAAIMAGDTERAASDYLVRALVIENRLGSDQGRGEVLNALGIAHQRLGELAPARDYFLQAINLRERAGDRSGVAATRANLAHLALLDGDYDLARRELETAIGERQQIGDQAGMADLYNQRGVVDEEVGDYRAALASYREGLRLREMLGQSRALADSYNNVAFANLMLGEFDSAHQFSRAALEKLDPEHNSAGRLMALETRGYVDIARGDWDGATRAFLEALDISRRINQPISEAVAHGGLGLVARHQGRWLAARDAYRQALDGLAALEDARGMAIYRLRLADLKLAAGQLDAAGALLDEIDRVDAAGQDAEYDRLLGELAQHRGNLAAAHHHFDQAHASATRRGNQVLAVEAEIAAIRVADSDDHAALIDRAQRLGHAIVTLDALTAASEQAIRVGDHEKAATLARRALRPPYRLQPWSDNWRLLWVGAVARELEQAGSSQADLASAREEVQRLLEAMPAAWSIGFVATLPAELRDVETDQD